jgi:hypothetical protein
MNDAEMELHLRKLRRKFQIQTNIFRERALRKRVSFRAYWCGRRHFFEQQN